MMKQIILGIVMLFCLPLIHAYAYPLKVAVNQEGEQDMIEEMSSDYLEFEGLPTTQNNMLIAREFFQCVVDELVDSGHDDDYYVNAVYKWAINDMMSKKEYYDVAPFLKKCS